MYRDCRLITNRNHVFFTKSKIFEKIKKWEGYSLPIFVKIFKNRHLLEFNKNTQVILKIMLKLVDA